MYNLSILIADDDKIAVSILTSMLEPYSDNILIARNGRQGLELFREHRPDIVLSDINMPEMGGLEMVHKIREIDENVKIAIFTNFEKRQILVKAIQYGVNQFFSKPFEVKHFSQVIEHLCEDVIEKRRIQAKLDRQQNILRAINAMATSFLQHTDWDRALYSELLRLKNAAEVSAVFIYKNDSQENPRNAKKVIAINDDESAIAKENIDFKRDHLLRWKKVLASGKCINGLLEDYDLSKQKLLKLFKIDSLLVLPVSVVGKWWGFLGIGNNRKRVIRATDIEMLETVASIIGSALNHQRNIRSLQLSSTVFRQTVDGVLITDDENRIIQVNNAFQEITGYTQGEVEGKDPKLLKSGRHDTHFYQRMWEQIERDGYWQGEITNRKKNGEIYIEWLSINAIKDDSGKVERHIGIFSDVTHQRKDAQAQAYLATHDPLTGLSNRLLLGDRLDHAINHAKRFGKCIAAIFCDLDNFKPINDLYGHSVGDEVLKVLAARMKESLRKDDTVCRYGGDEFVVLVEELKSFEKLNIVVNRLEKALNEPIKIDENVISTGASIGIALYPNDAENAEELLRNADSAMYRAKSSGKNKVVYFQPNPKIYCSSGYTI